MGAITGLLLCGSLSAPAQDKGYWRAVSSNANDITGDLTIGDTKVAINFASFPLAQIRKLQPAEWSAIFDADPGSGSGYLYRLNVPATKRFLHKNTLCGSDDTQWLATYAQGRSSARGVLFRSGRACPDRRLSCQFDRRLRHIFLLALTTSENCTELSSAHPMPKPPTNTFQTPKSRRSFAGI